MKKTLIIFLNLAFILTSSGVLQAMEDQSGSKTSTDAGVVESVKDTSKTNIILPAPETVQSVETDVNLDINNETGQLTKTQNITDETEQADVMTLDQLDEGEFPVYDFQKKESLTYNKLVDKYDITSSGAFTYSFPIKIPQG